MFRLSSGDIVVVDERAPPSAFRAHFVHARVEVLREDRVAAWCASARQIEPHLAVRSRHLPPVS